MKYGFLWHQKDKLIGMLVISTKDKWINLYELMKMVLVIEEASKRTLNNWNRRWILLFVILNIMAILQWLCIRRKLNGWRHINTTEKEFFTNKANIIAQDLWHSATMWDLKNFSRKFIVGSVLVNLDVNLP